MKWNNAVGRRGRTTQKNDIARRHDGTTRENDGIKRRQGRIPQKNDAKERRTRTTHKNDAKEQHLESTNCNYNEPDKHSAKLEQSLSTATCPVASYPSTYFQQRYKGREVHMEFVKQDLDDFRSGWNIKYRSVPAPRAGNNTQRWC